MQHIEVVSENLLQSPVEYDAEKQELHVTFKKNGARYTYHGVPQEIADLLATAPEAGKFFYANIRSNYTATKEA